MSALVERIIATRDRLKPLTRQGEDYIWRPAKDAVDVLADAANAITEREETIFHLRNQMEALRAATAPSTGDGDKGPGTPPDTSWNKRASPPGGEWRWVPVEPTFEMASAGGAAIWDHASLDRHKLVESAYRAMVSAAPPREAVGVGIEGASRTESTDARCDATAGDAQRKSEGQP